MANVDRSIREFLELIDARHQKYDDYQKNRGNLRLHSYDVPAGCEVHHIIPIGISHHNVVYRAGRAGWQINAPFQNSLALPMSAEDSEKYGVPLHRYGRNHDAYNKSVEKLLDEIEYQANENNFSDRDVRDALEITVDKIIYAIKHMGSGKYYNDPHNSDRRLRYTTYKNN